LVTARVSPEAEFVAAAEIASLLSIFRRRVYLLIEEDDTFPKPVGEPALAGSGGGRM
jgi:predicted DNA-binding transcriptional regulator AlpA